MHDGHNKKERRAWIPSFLALLLTCVRVIGSARHPEGVLISISTDAIIETHDGQTSMIIRVSNGDNLLVDEAEYVIYVHAISHSGEKIPLESTFRKRDLYQSHLKVGPCVLAFYTYDPTDR